MLRPDLVELGDAVAVRERSRLQAAILAKGPILGGDLHDESVLGIVSRIWRSDHQVDSDGRHRGDERNEDPLENAS
jgi:hypothetical protein